MKFNFFRKSQPQVSQKSLVLMYHRVASPYSDIWELAVSAERFEQQLKVLQQKMNIVSLQELIDASHTTGNMAAITFDDGYIDNFEVAKPILEKLQIPATFFITSKQNEIEHGYWWDILEYCILFTEQLPPVFELFSKNPQTFDLKDEARLTEELRNEHLKWNACTEPPPTLRTKLFFTLWQYLRTLPHEQQQQYLNKIKSWAGFPGLTDATYRTISPSEINELAGNSLFTIGAHTVTHPALGQHDSAFQKKEIRENRQYLQQLINKDVNFLAYPYGSYNRDTLKAARELGFNAAFSTEEKAFDKSTIYKLGRFQVKDITGEEFESTLNKWIA
jgi:peptidoglycan/xylan/chitin deacetylase (PgdA/CDA1 family)